MEMCLAFHRFNASAPTRLPSPMPGSSDTRMTDCLRPPVPMRVAQRHSSSLTLRSTFPTSPQHHPHSTSTPHPLTPPQQTLFPSLSRGMARAVSHARHARRVARERRPTESALFRAHGQCLSNAGGACTCLKGAHSLWSAPPIRNARGTAAENGSLGRHFSLSLALSARDKGLWTLQERERAAVERAVPRLLCVRACACACRQRGDCRERRCGRAFAAGRLEQGVGSETRGCELQVRRWMVEGRW